MKKIVTIIIIIIGLGSLIFTGLIKINQFGINAEQSLTNNTRENLTNNLNQPNQNTQCKIGPILYKIGDFDSRFGLTQSQFQDATKQAENIWESAIGANLFEFDKFNGQLKINLIFDERQAETLLLRNINKNIGDDKQNYDELKKSYENATDIYNQQVAKFKTLSDLYQKKLETYNNNATDYEERKKKYEERVQYWNNLGGAPKLEYELLRQEKESLDKMYLNFATDQQDINNLGKILDQERVKLENSIDQVNVLAGMLNRLAQKLNLSIDQYNSVQSQGITGKEFTQGLYQKSGNQASIDIYSFFDNKELVLVLAHELGHALGIGHVENSASIMYHIMGNQSEKLTSQDIEALKNICAK